MTTPTRMTTTMQQLVDRAEALASSGRRRLIGIVGAPGAGKSTLSAALVSALGADRVVVVPMDGFHLSNAELERQGLRRVKGAVTTFDDGGYAALLRRLRDQQPGEVVYAPYFDRSLEESIGSAVRVEADVPLVITEGNYLLADTGAWPSARAALDETWYLRTDDELRLAWLIARHVEFGKTPDEAEEWVMRSDEVNARFIATTAHRADLVVDIGVG
ncbi:nucleoside/nucleotide kinase family protein [Agilicoccus flavus]|uniref:nucleoside/nucleotide kinase family protein n=1 Tax=Agilicoccus flavus TaxID=2775968 RepID=UPI001CF66618|nr:nucleoside/nucleotide kinase family protein [Agilicoccus flavus]